MDQLVSLSKIFSEKTFRIPDYQRGYAWTTKEVEEFWSDLYRLEDAKNHYIGVLTLEPVNFEEYKKWIDDIWIIESKRYIPYYVVDGQQRLTTSILLLTAILEVMEEKAIRSLNYTSQDEIRKKFIYETKESTDSLTYLFGYEVDNPSYHYLIANIYKYQRIITGKIEETSYTNNLTNAKQIFVKKLKELDKNQIESIYTKITQHFLFNVYTISSDIDVHVTFETMNNRGKPLSHLELMKNRLIYLTTLFQCGEDQRSRLRRDINICWKEIYNLLGRISSDKVQDDEFLTAHFMLYFSKTINEFSQDEKYDYFYLGGRKQTDYLLNKYFVPNKAIDKTLSIKDCSEYIHSLGECIKLWDEIKNPLDSKKPEEIKEYMQKLRFLSYQPSRYYSRFSNMSGLNYVNVFILACFQACKSNDTILFKYLKALEKYLFIMMFYNQEIFRQEEEEEIKPINFNDLVLKLNKNEIGIQEIIEKLNKAIVAITTSQAIIKKTVSRYKTEGFYTNQWIKYFLAEYEVKLMKSSKSNIPKLNRDIYFSNGYDSIEHIYPRNGRNAYWNNIYSGFSPKEKSALKNSLGNLVAISSNKNSKLGNQGFPDKKANEHNKAGYKYGTYSEIEISFEDDWRPNEILKRGLKLTDFLTERWDIKIPKNERKQFLGLGFL